MTNKERRRCKRSLAAKYDKTDGLRFEHYSRDGVAAANHASRGQDHD